VRYKIRKMTQIVIVDKTGTLKEVNAKDLNKDDLYKKCGFKKSDGFEKLTEWTTKISGEGKFITSVYGKTDGKANMENKYDFPPPIDTTLIFGSCVVICETKQEDGKVILADLTIDLWNKIYEKLFGGFEDLTATCAEDEEEEDELAAVPDKYKTKQGYLKDGFVVDSDDSGGSYCTDDDDESSDVDEDDTGEDEELNIEDIGSELDEEEYD
jgi:hypothetical protein